MLRGSCHCGAVSWTHDETPASVTACNCTICRRYGALWAYGLLGKSVHVSGETHAYRRADQGAIDFHFCKTCGCLTHYVTTQDGNLGARAAVNTRMCAPEEVTDLPIKHFDGLEKFESLGQDGRTVRDIWF